MAGIKWPDSPSGQPFNITDSAINDGSGDTMKKHKKAPEWPGDIYYRLPPEQQKLIRKMVAKVSAKVKRGGLKLIQGGRS
jgi:hypothetical protein